MSYGPILETKAAAIRALTAKHRAANPRLFGSVLRERDHADSDIDILVDALPGTTLFGIRCQFGDSALNHANGLTTITPFHSNPCCMSSE